ncbi:MAG: 8-oxo-dGTP diphosphatase [Pseudomonadota bacterium]
MLALATLVYLVKDQRTLMIHRATRTGDWHSGKYNGLGGKLQEGETPWECARREVQEESGLTLTKGRFKGHLLFPHFDPFGRDWLVFVYRGDVFEGELKEGTEEGKPLWVPDHDIGLLNLWEGDHYFLPYIYGHDDTVFDGKFYYKEGHLTAYAINLL